MAKVQFGIPDNGTISFWFDDIWTPEGYLRIVMWRDIDADNDRALIGGATYKSKEVVFRGETVTRITDSFRVDVNPRVILRKPRYKKRVEKRFKQALIDGFDLEFYDTPSNEDITLENNLLKPIMQVDDTPYERLFSKYIKPQTDTEVYCAWYFKEDGTDEYVLRTTGQLQNAIQGIDHQWSHNNTLTPYWTFGVNKPLDRETVWSLKFSNVAIIGLGKTPARPTQNPSETGTWYMPFYNPNPTDAHASDTSELPFSSELPDPSTATSKVVQGVSQITYTDSTVAERVPMWRRHIPVHYALKLLYDYAYGSYSFTSDNSPFTFIPAKFENLDGSADNYGGIQSEMLYDSSNRKTVNPASVLPDKWFLLPQCLFGLYDQIENGGQAVTGNPVPIPQKHWGNTFESAFELINELAFGLGLVPIVQHRAAGSTIHFKERGTAFDNKFSFIIPTQATPELFPEFESGVKITRRETFKNAAEEDGDYDEWFAKFANTGTLNQDISRYANPVANPLTLPLEAQKPAEMEFSMTFGGAHMTGANDVFNSTPLDELVYWYSVGTPDVSVGRMTGAQSTVSEQFPMFSPLILGGGAIYADANTAAVGGGATGRYFAPILSALWDGGEYADRTATYANVATTDDFTITGEGALFRTYRELLAAFYSAHFVRSDEKYTIVVPTITQFTDQTTGSATKGDKSWQFIDILYQTELFGYDWYVQSVEQDFEAMTTRFELYRLNPTLKTFSDEELEERGGGTPIDYYPDTTPVITGIVGAQPAQTLGGTSFMMAIVPSDLPISGVTAKVMPAGTAYDLTPMGNGQWYIDFDTTTSANGTYDLRFRATSIDGTTADKTVNITITN